MYLFYEQMNVENKKRVSETEGRRVYICTSIYKDIWKKESLSKFIFSWTLFHWLQNDSLLTTSVWLKHCFVFFFWRRRDMLATYVAANWLQDKTSKQMNRPDFLVGFKKCNTWLHSALLNHQIRSDPSTCHTSYNILLS